MAKSERTGNGKGRPIIIRRDEVEIGSHHGGAWKVAYADFVTAMMAFFLVMWLINATTVDQRRGLADYFSPTSLMSHHSSGTGRPFGGKTAFSSGSMVSDDGAVEVTVGLQPVLDNPIAQHRPVETPPHGGHGAGRAGADATAQGALGPGIVSAAAGTRPGQAGTPGASGGAGAMAGGGAGGGGNEAAGTAVFAAADAPAGMAIGMAAARTTTERPGGMSPGPAGSGPAGTLPGAGPAPILLPSGPPVAHARPTLAAPPPTALSPTASPPAASPLAAPPPANQARIESQAFIAARAAIKRLILADPRLAAVASQLAIDITPRGLRIQLLDSRRVAMFLPGSAEPNPPARRLLRLIGPIVAALAGPVRIAGFTDAAPYKGGGASNWDLSAARANAARRLLTAAGLADARVQAVTGHGDHDLLLPRDPLAPANRRISILVLRGAAAAPVASPAAASVAIRAATPVGASVATPVAASVGAGMPPT
ncbi:MAG: flagellar motor protein MotB [Acetobacteraceae bacterium]